MRLIAGTASGFDSALGWLDDRFDRWGAGRFQDAPLAAVLLAPALLVLGVFGIAPLAAALYMSFFGGKHGMGVFVGWENYKDALTSPAFWRSFSVTAYYALGTVPASLVFSFAIAYALSKIVRGRAFFRMVYFLPYITSAVASAMIWRSLFNAQGGIFNLLLHYSGIEPQQWLLEPRGVLHLISGGSIPANVGPSLALCCIVLFDIWHSSGFMIVVFLAGLTAVPRELEEAARIDGAGAYQVLKNITLPFLSPTLFFLAIVSTIRACQAFNSFYALTQGGGRTLGTTENLIMHIYSNFYEYGFWGYGAAVATLLSLAIIVLTAIQWRMAARRVLYA